VFEVKKIFFQLDARNEDKTEDNLIFSEDLAEDCQSRGYMSNFSDRIKNLEKKISEFQKEDNINNLTKLNNVAMSSNNNTQSARESYNIENQLGKQHTTKLFKNLQEAEAEELDIDSAAKEVAEMLIACSDIELLRLFILEFNSSLKHSSIIYQLNFINSKFNNSLVR